MKIGYKLFAEAFSPQELVAQAVRAEEAGFDFVEISNHYLRYHPAIVAQAAATTALLCDGRFTLGVGAGERLNEHVVGRGWPAAGVRHEMLREALEIIRLLWSGGYQSYQGRHLTLEDARVFDLPDTPPRIAVAIGGPEAAQVAAELGDAIFATEPEAELVGAYREAGGDGPRYGEVPLAFAPDEETAAESAHRLIRFGPLGWKVQAELPNPVNFEAATAFVTPDDLKQTVACGPDPERHLEVARQFADAGFDHLALLNAGPDPDGFFDFFTRELADPLRALKPA